MVLLLFFCPSQAYPSWVTSPEPVQQLLRCLPASCLSPSVFSTWQEPQSFKPEISLPHLLLSHIEQAQSPDLDLACPPGCVSHFLADPISNAPHFAAPQPTGPLAVSWMRRSYPSSGSLHALLPQPRIFFLEILLGSLHSCVCTHGCHSGGPLSGQPSWTAPLAFLHPVSIPRAVQVTSQPEVRSAHSEGLQTPGESFLSVFSRWHWRQSAYTCRVPHTQDCFAHTPWEPWETPCQSQTAVRRSKHFGSPEGQCIIYIYPSQQRQKPHSWEFSAIQTVKRPKHMTVYFRHFRCTIRPGLFLLCVCFKILLRSNSSHMEGNKHYNNKHPFISRIIMEVFPVCIVSRIPKFLRSTPLIRFSIGGRFC